jgi:hypothetical protein
LSLEQLRRKLLMSAEDIDVPGWDQNTGAGLLDAKQALKADPDHYLISRITQVGAAPPEGDAAQVEVQGLALGSDLQGVRLQVGFGEEPAQGDWKTVHFSKESLSGLIHRVPLTTFDRPGTWTIRLLVQDRQNTVRQSRARLNLD